MALTSRATRSVPCMSTSKSMRLRRRPAGSVSLTVSRRTRTCPRCPGPSPSPRASQKGAGSASMSAASRSLYPFSTSSGTRCRIGCVTNATVNRRDSRTDEHCHRHALPRDGLRRCAGCLRSPGPCRHVTIVLFKFVPACLAGTLLDRLTNQSPHLTSQHISSSATCVHLWNATCPVVYLASSQLVAH